MHRHRHDAPGRWPLVRPYKASPKLDANIPRQAASANPTHLIEP